MTDSDRLISPSISDDDRVVDRAIRPSTLLEYVGQTTVCEQMEIFIPAAKEREEALDHVLIFGPPVINLRISGAVDIHGAWRNETTEGLTASRLGNTRNEPDFKQQVQINVNGTIGDKLTIAADWNTERTFEYENQLSIKYTGYEDEIIQSIEAGNVSLQTSPLVGGSEALFGIKARFQMGPFSLTALASQKKGEVEEVSLTGGSETQTFEKHAYDYSDNHYFVDTVYAETGEGFNIFNKIYGNPNPVVDDDKSTNSHVSIDQTSFPKSNIEKAYIGLIEYFERNDYKLYCVLSKCDISSFSTDLIKIDSKKLSSYEQNSINMEIDKINEKLNNIIEQEFNQKLKIQLAFDIDIETKTKTEDRDSNAKSNMSQSIVIENEKKTDEDEDHPLFDSVIDDLEGKLLK
mgnify:CR=1 FL=1